MCGVGGVTRCDSANVLRNAAAMINTKRDYGSYAFVLKEMAGHIDQVRRGEVTLDEFTRFYMIEKQDGEQ